MANKNIKKELEKDIQNACCQYLALKKYFFWRQNTTPIYNISLKMFRSMPKYAKKGVPDIILIHKERGTIYLEVKRPGNKLNVDQVVFEEACKKLNQEYHIITNIEDLQKIDL